jgi:hypothetical protein
MPACAAFPCIAKHVAIVKAATLEHVKVYFIFRKNISGGFGGKILLTIGKVVCPGHTPESVTRIVLPP